MPYRPSGITRVAVRAASAAQRRLHRFGALGENSLIRPPYTITSARCIYIGTNTVIGPNALLSVVTEHLGQRYAPRLKVGDDCSIGQNFVVSCLDEVVIGDKVLISSNVFLGDSMHGYDDPAAAVIDQPLLKRGAVRVEDGAFIGINAIVLPGVRIGRNAVVGAGAVVTADVPDCTVVAGNPARVIRKYDPIRQVWLRPNEELAREPVDIPAA